MINKNNMGILYIHENGNFARRSSGEIVPCNIVLRDNNNKKFLVAYTPLMNRNESSYWGFKWIAHKNIIKLHDMEYEDLKSKFL